MDKVENGASGSLPLEDYCRNLGKAEHLLSDDELDAVAGGGIWDFMEFPRGYYTAESPRVVPWGL